ncbi:MAG: hypothetical protein AB7R90_14125 [Reyranellaceae bacterium]
MRPAPLLLVLLALALPAQGWSQPAPPANRPAAAAPLPSAAPTLRVWRSVASAEGGYRVELPGNPAERRVEQKDAGGRLIVSHLQEVSLDGGQTYFAMVWTQIGVPVDAAETEKLLTRVRDGTTAALKGTLITTRAAALGSLQGLDYVIEAGPAATRYRYRVFVLGHRIVQQVYSGRTGSENSPEVRKFHQSLKPG